MRCLAKIRKYSLLGFAAAVLSQPLMGCAGGPNQEELALLDEQRQAADSAEKKLEAKKAEKAKLEQRLNEKKAEKKALEEKKAAVKAALK